MPDPVTDARHITRIQAEARRQDLHAKAHAAYEAAAAAQRADWDKQVADAYKRVRAAEDALNAFAGVRPSEPAAAQAYDAVVAELDAARGVRDSLISPPSDRPLRDAMDAAIVAADREFCAAFAAAVPQDSRGVS